MQMLYFESIIICNDKSYSKYVVKTIYYIRNRSTIHSTIGTLLQASSSRSTPLQKQVPTWGVSHDHIHDRN